jgi:phosphatidate cytidylyltransferase
MFLQRFLVTAVLGPLALYLIYLGGWFYFLPIAGVMLLSVVEYNGIMRRMGWNSALWLLLPGVAAQLIAGQWPEYELFAPLAAVTIFLMLCRVLWQYEKGQTETAVADWLVMTFGLIYLGWIGSHFFRLRNLPEMAWQWTMFAMLITWLVDSAGYVFGKTWGRRKLSPRLSPNKTVEGYVGGLLIGLSFSVILSYVLTLPLWAAVGLGLLLSVLGTVGDLSISLIKREAGVKDSGHFLPGHGGALDRIDSLVWAVVIAYYWVTLLVL